MYKLTIGNVPGLYSNRLRIYQNGTASTEEQLSEARRNALSNLQHVNINQLTCVATSVRTSQEPCYNEENEVEKWVQDHSFQATRVADSASSKYFLARRGIKHFFDARNVTRITGEEVTVLGATAKVPYNHYFRQVSPRTWEERVPGANYLRALGPLNADCGLQDLRFPKGPIRCIYNGEPTIFQSAADLIGHCNDNYYEQHEPALMLPVEFETIRFTLNAEAEIIAAPTVVQTFLFIGADVGYSARDEFRKDFGFTGRKAYRSTFKNYVAAPKWTCSLEAHQRNVPDQGLNVIDNVIFSKIMLSSEFSQIKEVAVLEKARQKLESHSQNDSLESLNYQVEALIERIRSYETYNETARSNMSDLNDRIDDSMNALNELSSEEPDCHIEMERDHLNQHIDGYVNDVNYYVERIARREKRIAEWEEEVCKLTERISNFDNSKVEKLVKRIQLLTTKVQRKSKEILDGSTAVNWVENYRRSNFVLDNIVFTCPDRGRITADDQNIDSLLTDKNIKIHSMRLYNETHLEIKLDARTAMENGLEPKTRLAGPLIYDLTFDGGYPTLYIKPKDNTCIVGQFETSLCLHPHTGTSYQDTLLSDFDVRVCLGEAEGGLAQAWSDKDIDLAIQFIIGWATNADTTDTWGVKGKTFFPGPGDQVALPKEEYLEVLRASATLGIVGVEYKSKTNTLRYDLTEKGWTHSKNNVTYRIFGDDVDNFVKVKLEKLSRSSVYTETNRF